MTEDPRRRGGHGGGSGESEAELATIRAHYADARLMEHLGRLATRTVDDAEALIGALWPLAARIVPRAEPALMRATPHLVPGLSGAARVLREHPSTRPLVRRIPTVARRTAIDLGRRASVASPTPPEVAVRALARQAMRVLGEGGTGQAGALLESGSSRRGGSAPGRPRLSDQRLRLAIQQAAKLADATPFRSSKGCNDLCVSMIETLDKGQGIRVGFYPIGGGKLPTKQGVAPPEGWDAHIVVKLYDGRVVDPLRRKIYPSLHALRADIFTAPVRTQIER